MKDFIPNYKSNDAPTIVVSTVRHNLKKGGLPAGKQVVSRNGTFKNTRDLLARDIKELRRVYPDIPNSKLKELINKNKKMYPDAFKKPCP